MNNRPLRAKIKQADRDNQRFNPGAYAPKKVNGQLSVCYYRLFVEQDYELGIEALKLARAFHMGGGCSCTADAPSEAPSGDKTSETLTGKQAAAQARSEAVKARRLEKKLVSGLPLSDEAKQFYGLK